MLRQSSFMDLPMVPRYASSKDGRVKSLQGIFEITPLVLNSLFYKVSEKLNLTWSFVLEYDCISKFCHFLNCALRLGRSRLPGLLPSFFSGLVLRTFSLQISYLAPFLARLLIEALLQSDMFSLGIVMFEMLSSFATEMERAIALSAIRSGRLSAEFVSNYPVHARVIQSLLKTNGKLRPEAREILSSDLFVNKDLVSAEEDGRNQIESSK